MRRIPVKSSNHRRWTILGCAMLFIVLVLLVLELTNTTHFFHKKVSTIASTHPETSIKSTNGSTKSSTNSSDTKANSTKNTAPATTPSGSAPIVPSGTFISNHQPSLSGQGGVPSSESSVCVTTPGASCYIEFTQGNIVKQLASQTTDANGAAYWSWDVNKDGFSTGSWQVTAVATSGGQTTKSTDPQPLVVKP